MAFSINRAVLLGNLTRDPELKYTPSGTAVCSFGVATNNSIKNKQTGEWKDVPTFHNVKVWANKAEWCAKSLVKGAKVYIEGRIDNSSWEDKNGIKKYRSEIVANEVISMAKGTKKNSVSNDSELPKPTDDLDVDNLDLDDVFGDDGQLLDDAQVS